MSVRAKFKVQAIEQYSKVESTDPQGNPHVYHPTRVTMAPVYVNNEERKAGNKENEVFGYYTPNGRIELSINNDEASSQFKVDQEFYVDFTAVEQPSEA